MIGRILDLAERYVRSTERIASAQEQSLRIAQQTADSTMTLAKVHERAQAQTSAPSALDISDVAEAIRGVRELLDALRGRLAPVDCASGGEK